MYSKRDKEKVRFVREILTIRVCCSRQPSRG